MALVASKVFAFYGRTKRPTKILTKAKMISRFSRKKLYSIPSKSSGRSHLIIFLLLCSLAAGWWAMCQLMNGGQKALLSMHLSSDKKCAALPYNARYWHFDKMWQCSLISDKLISNVQGDLYLVTFFNPYFSQVLGFKMKGILFIRWQYV